MVCAAQTTGKCSGPIATLVPWRNKHETIGITSSYTQAVCSKVYQNDLCQYKWYSFEVALLPGDRISNRFRVLRPLGSGGAATIYLVEDERARTECVLKLLELSGEAALAGFRAEFALLSRVLHPHLVRVRDFGSFRADDALSHFYTADFIEGTALANQKFTDTPAIKQVVVEVLDALATLHALGIRHGDVTPDNILVESSGRTTLIDLGCARPLDWHGANVSGTPGFIAPELLATGSADARADLYSLGMTLRALLERSALSSSRELNTLCSRLSAHSASDRPNSALEVLQQLGGALGPQVSLPCASASLLGRERELLSFQRWQEQLATGRGAPRVVCIIGAASAGVSRLTQELCARAELELEVWRARAGEVEPLSWLLGALEPGSLQQGAGVAEILDAAARFNERPTPLLLVIEEAQRLPIKQQDGLWALGRCLRSTAKVGLLIAGLRAPHDVESETLELGPLDLDCLRQWTRRSLSDGVLREVLARSTGLPGRIELELLRLAQQRGHQPSARVRTGSALPALDLSSLPERERDGLALLCAMGGESELHALELPPHDFRAAIAAGWITRDAGRLRVRELVRVAAAFDPTVLRAAHERAAALCERRARASVHAATHWAEMLRQLALAQRFEELERRLQALRPIWSGAPRTFVAELPLDQLRAATSSCLVLIAELCLRAGEFRSALSALSWTLRRRPKAKLRAACELQAAEALIQLGRGARAERLVRRWCAAHVDAATRSLALERSSRARLQGGDARAALTFTEQGLELVQDSDTRRLLLEAQGVALSYLGQLERATSLFSHVLSQVVENEAPRDSCRLLGRRAITAFRAGKWAEAATDHARALELAERHALDDLVSVCLLNLGTAQQQLGELAAALRSYERGLAVAHAIGRESTELTLRYNLANLCCTLGHQSGAAAELDALERRASAPQRARFAPAVGLLRAEIAMSCDELARAEQELRGAQATFSERELKRELAEVEVQFAKLWLARGELEQAERSAQSAEAAANAEGAQDLALLARFVAAKTRVARSLPSAKADLLACLAQATAQGQRALEAEIGTLLYSWASAHGDAEASEWATRARRSWDRLAAQLPDALRDIFWRDPRRAPVERRTRPELATTAAAGDAQAFRRLLSLSRRVNSSLSLERVLTYAVEAAVELSLAERGFLLLLQDGAPRLCARYPERPSDEPPSHSIVARVLASEQALLTTDAQADQRLERRGSIHALRLKSVLCVPIVTPSGLLGALYVDSRLDRARFSAAHEELLVALSDQVAVAVENARLHEALQTQREELLTQKRTVERLASARERELARLKARVIEQARELGFRYDYSNIVGNSAAMRHVFAQLDRVTDANVNVLIQGESGTGKELVARALHFNGPRREAPFVGVNCATLPENLLESELFGHVRGAFTGAERDKTGLLLEAGEGTLFLDEIGELPLGMQAKLLRAVQEREVRPVGSTRSLPFRARLVSATHRELLTQAASGRFREDLYYRLAVVVLQLPALRERLEDLPMLVQSILERLAREQRREPPELSQQAHRLLANYDFPGNVRELENILTRALVFGGQRIEASDLELRRARERKRSSNNRLDFEHEERERILGALRAQRWNVSQVARSLGIPRNTFYRKLKRYGLDVAALARESSPG